MGRCPSLTLSPSAYDYIGPVGPVGTLSTSGLVSGGPGELVRMISPVDHENRLSPFPPPVDEMSSVDLARRGGGGANSSDLDGSDG